MLKGIAPYRLIMRVYDAKTLSGMPQSPGFSRVVLRQITQGMFQAYQRSAATWLTIFGTLRPKQNNLVIWLRHNGENKHLATPLSMYFLDMLVMDIFPIYFTQNHYFCFYFFTLAFYFVPSLDNQELCESRGVRPGLSVLTSHLVSVDVKLYWTMLRHWVSACP